MKTALPTNREAVGVAVRPECGVCGIGSLDEGVEIDAEAAESGQRLSKRMADPKMTTKGEVDEHSLTHLPYMN